MSNKKNKLTSPMKKRKLVLQETKRKDDHRMDELKNEWLHYIVDPELLKPYEKRIKELKVELHKEEEEEENNNNNNNNNEKIITGETTNQIKKNSIQKIANALLKDPTCDLSIQSLNDNILKQIIVEEGIECLQEQKNNAIEFIFTREFKN